MKPNCLTALEELIVSSLPRYIAAKRASAAPLFALRLNFYDTHAPTCYFELAVTYLSSATQLIAQGSPHRFSKLWASAEAGADEYLYFPEHEGDDLASDPVLDACYQFLCDDSVSDAYRHYASAICSAAFRMNSNISAYFPGESDIFSVVPADDSFECLGDDDAIRLSVPPERIEALIKAGFLDGCDERFGIYPKDIYGY